MPSENNHIDNFFRNKAAEASVDYSRVDADWKQMQTMLPKPETLPVHNLPPGSHFMKYLSYAAAVVVVGTMVVAVSKTKQQINTRKDSSPRIEIVTKRSNPAPVVPNINDDTNKVATKTTPVVTINSTPIINQTTYAPITQNTVSTFNIKPDESVEEPLTIKPDSRTVFSNFYNAIRKPEQLFLVDNRRDTTLNCSEGTKVFIPAGCLRTVADFPISGVIQFHILEFYEYADIISNKLSTTSAGMPIETGGMLHISATYSNEPVIIRPEAPITIKMPARDFKPDMQLFIAASTESRPGEFNNESKGSGPWINWLDAGQQQYLMNDATKRVRVTNWLDEPYSVKHRRNKTTAKFKLAKNSDFTLAEATYEIESRYGSKYDEIKIKPDRVFWKKRYTRKFRYRNEGYTSNGFVGDSIYLPLSIAMKNSLLTKADSLKYEANRKREFEEALRMKKSVSEYIKIASSYDFKIRDLGWINCDRFLTYPRSRLTDMAFDPGPGFEGIYFEAKMIFDNERAIMPGFWNNGKVVFQNLPVGHKVHVICTGAKDGKLFASFQEFIVKPHQSPVLSFEETSPREFRDKLSQFGAVK